MERKECVKLRLNEVLKEKGITKIAAARMCGINKQYFYHITNGTKPISITKLGEVAKVLGVELADLIAREKPLTCPHCGEQVIRKTE